MKSDNQNLIEEKYETGFNYSINKTNLNISFNRIAFIFFIFFITAIIFSLKVIYLGLLNKPNIEKVETKINFLTLFFSLTSIKSFVAEKFVFQTSLLLKESRILEAQCITTSGLNSLKIIFISTLLEIKSHFLKIICLLTASEILSIPKIE